MNIQHDGVATITHLKLDVSRTTWTVLPVDGHLPILALIQSNPNIMDLRI